MVTVPGNWIKTVLGVEPKRHTTGCRVPAEAHGGLRNHPARERKLLAGLDLRPLNQAMSPEPCGPPWSQERLNLASPRSEMSIRTSVTAVGAISRTRAACLTVDAWYHGLVADRSLRSELR